MNPFGVAQLSVVKRAPRLARVGERVQFELTVRNVADVTARMADIPPAALTLAQLQSTGAGRARLVRGNAVWRLGSLAPGTSRVVRGRVLIEAGAPGLKRNIVAATAVNAAYVANELDTRVLTQRRTVPPVTG